MGNTADPSKRLNLLSTMSMPKMAKGKDMSNMLTNCAMFSTFKRTDSHAVRGRPTRKDGVVIYERLFRNLSFRELKIAKESSRITS